MIVPSSMNLSTPLLKPATAFPGLFLCEATTVECYIVLLWEAQYSLHGLQVHTQPMTETHVNLTVLRACQPARHFGCHLYIHRKLPMYVEKNTSQITENFPEGMEYCNCSICFRFLFI